jgi:PAS domain-containing protein
LKNTNSDIQASNRIISIINNSKEQYEKILNELENAYVIVNERFEILDANKQFSELLNEHFLRNDLFNYIYPASVDLLKQELSLVLKNQVPSSLEIKLISGRSYLFTISLLPVKRKEEGAVLKLLGTDITELREREGLIMDVFRSVSVGLVVVNNDNKIMSGFSSFTKIILENSNLLSQDIFDVFFNRNVKVISEDEQKALNELRSFGGTTKDDFNVLTFGIPKMFELPSTLRVNGKRVIQVTFEPFEEEGVISRYLMILQDMSDYVNLNPPTFYDDLSKMVKQAEIDLESLSAIVDDVISMSARVPKDLSSGIGDELRGVFHSIKGMLRMVGLSYMAGIVHELESEITLFLEGGNSSSQEKWNEFKASWEKFLIIYHATINDVQAQSTENKVVDARPIEVMNSLSSLPKDLASHSFLSPVFGMNKCTFVDALDIINFSLKLIEKNSMDLGLSVKPKMSQDKIWIDDSSYSTMKAALIHLINNSFAHGFHGQGERQDLQISLDCRRVGQEIILNYRDNGSGINVAKVRQKLVKENVLSESESKAKPDDEIANYIFHSGLSTKDEVNELAGRGIGLSGALLEIERLGGSLKIMSYNSGTHFELRLPVVNKALQHLSVVGGDVLSYAFESYWPAFQGKIKKNIHGFYACHYPALFYQAFDEVTQSKVEISGIEFASKPFASQTSATPAALDKAAYLLSHNNISIHYDGGSKILSLYFGNNLSSPGALSFTLNADGLDQDSAFKSYLSQIEKDFSLKLTLNSGSSDLHVRKYNNEFVPSIIRSLEQKLYFQFLGSLK